MYHCFILKIEVSVFKRVYQYFDQQMYIDRQERVPKSNVSCLLKTI